MATKKYQVFVSSTFRDLVDERQDAIRNILDLNHIPAGMELFPAADVEQLSYIKKVIDECDYYLLMVGGRYGSMDAEGVSFTEREYDYAVETGKVVLAFVHDDPTQIPLGKSDTDPSASGALQAFRQKVMTGRLVRTWTTRQNLESVVLKALMHAFNQMPQTGWIRGNAAANDHVLEQANKALEENAALRAELIMLKAVQPQRYDNLADLNDSVRARFRTQFTPRHGSSIYTSHTTDLRLQDVFLRVAADLSTPKTDLTISIALKQLIGEASGDTPYDVNNMDVAMIKAQFMALDLITGQTGTSVQGVLHEYLSLTEKGKRLYLEGMVVRKAIPEP
ncbi:DUF4062 domain-containing protein [Rhizobium sp. RAF56]|uniref:DUF4062 domain-containing protein n=1 Tax=Rhizobium sp. RAF56 TaxID=3233062 RepID=UPI003F95F005